MPKAKPVQPESDGELLREALLSVGADKKAVGRLVSSKEMERVVVPIYWKDGIVVKANFIQLLALPKLLRSFRREFPDGQVRWDPDYRGEKPGDGDVAIHIFFNYQEDDQGDHWDPKPDTPEIESYYRMIKRFSYDGDKPVSASKIIHA